MSPRPPHRFAHLPSQLNPFFPESGEKDFLLDMKYRKGAQTNKKLPQFRQYDRTI